MLATTKKLDEGVVIATVSDRLAVVFHQMGGSQKAILYVGFPKLEAAQSFYGWAKQKGLTFDFQTGSGACKPRPAKRVNSPWEIKVHRPPQWLVDKLLEKAKTAAAA